MSENKVVVRFAPSPSGPLHIGGARTALFNYLFARQHGGQFLLRIDNTDPARSQSGYEDDIKAGLAWLGLAPTAIYRQSDRIKIYQSALETLLRSGRAYWSEEESPRPGGRARVIRFHNPGERVTFQDLIKGEVAFSVDELGDFVIARDLDSPIYHFASVVDDMEMKITQVIRGEDHLSNTPRQILLAQALGQTPPAYAHIPLILAPDRSKLSKRHGAVALLHYREEGYLKEAMNNFLATLGWSPQAAGMEQEIFSLPELTRHFKLEQVQSGGAIFNLQKLNWFNRFYLKQTTPDQLMFLIKSYLPTALTIKPQFDDARLIKILPELVGRIDKLSDVRTLAEKGELDYWFARPVADKKLLKTGLRLPALLERLEPIPENQFTAEAIKEAVWDFASAAGRAEVLWPMRAALTGREKSADPFIVAAVLGKKETLIRLTDAQNW